jgi:Tfp pilus assembly protein PilP
VALDPHRRDPFVNPLQLQEDKMKNTAACTTGARCLMIDQVVLKGVVKTQAGMIAMVENSAKKQYNLREKDPVYNGFVLKITGDTIVFKETTVDTIGKSNTREVVKRVTVPAV